MNYKQISVQQTVSSFLSQMLRVKSKVHKTASARSRMNLNDPKDVKGLKACSSSILYATGQYGKYQLQMSGSECPVSNENRL